MNDLAKPDLKYGVLLSCIPEVGPRRRMRRKLKFQLTAVCAVVIMIATCRGLALDPSQSASSYLRKNFTIDDGLPANEVNAILQTQNQDIVAANFFVAKNVVAQRETVSADAPAEYKRLTNGAERLSVDFRFRTGRAELDNKAIVDLDRVIGFVSDLHYSGD